MNAPATTESQRDAQASPVEEGSPKELRLEAVQERPSVLAAKERNRQVLANSVQK